MSEIDVEPVEEANDADADADVVGEAADTAADTATDLPAGVDAPDYVLYGGKGGVGKTTMAAATALSSAAGGVATLVVSTDPAHSLSDTFGVEIPPQPAEIHADYPLYAAEIDPDAAMEEGLFGGDGDPLGGLDELGELGGVGGLGGDTGTSDGPGRGPGPGPGPADPSGDEPEGVAGLLGGTVPGADEAAAMRQLLEYLDDPRFDRVVVDTAPTGHPLRLLELPEVMDSMVGRMLKLRQQFSGMMEGLKGMFGGGDDGSDASADLEELRDRIERLRAVLRDPDRTDFRVVMVPEEMSVVESERLIERLDGFEIPVRTVVVNRVMEDPDRIAGVEFDPDWIVTPNLESCEFCSRRWEVQQTALARATDLFRSRAVKRVPLLAEEVRGEAALRVVAACLDADPAGA
jgi:arsenite-transporting ATPase